MKEYKRQMEMFSLYDQKRIKDRMEKMAADGWLIEQPGNFLWRYRRIRPIKAQFEITYFPKASEFDPEPTEGQRRMEEYCAFDGWKLAAQWGQMQIFYNEAENPRPIETDAVTKVETIHKAMRRSMIPSMLLLVGIIIIQLAMKGWQMSRDLVRVLSTSMELYMIIAWLFLLLSALTELGTYFHWYHRAKRQAENGIFLEVRTKRWRSLFLLAASLVFMILGMSGMLMGRSIFLLSISYVLVIMITANLIRRWMKKKGYGRGTNRTVSVLAVAAVATLFLAGMTAGIVRHGLPDERKPVGTYVVENWSRDVYADPLPLYIEDLSGASRYQYSTERRTEETFLAAQTEYRQWALSEEQDALGLEYTVVGIKAPFLYDSCKKAMIGARKDEIVGGKVMLRDSYEPVDAAPWGAKEAYRHLWGDGYRNRYLLCYEDRIVEIRFGWEPTAAQMAVVGKKLGR